jgi:maltose alpha-D-glucosyltransferase/alpha-amylase
MQLYGRGIRRRLAPMLGNDQARLRLAYSLQFTLPGTPVLRYGEELGMGDDLSLHGRDALRTPMQWSRAAQGGFSSAAETVLPVVADGEYGYGCVNVADAQRDPDSLLAWFQRMIYTLRECPEIGDGICRTLEVGPHSVLVHRVDAAPGALLFLHNLDDREVVVDVGEQEDVPGEPADVFADQRYDEPTRALSGLRVAGNGFRWIRLASGEHWRVA